MLICQHRGLQRLAVDLLHYFAERYNVSRDRRLIRSNNADFVPSSLSFQVRR